MLLRCWCSTARLKYAWLRFQQVNIMVPGLVMGPQGIVHGYGPVCSSANGKYYFIQSFLFLRFRFTLYLNNALGSWPKTRLPWRREWTSAQIAAAEQASVAVLYASAYGNTAALAQAISRGITKAGDALPCHLSISPSLACLAFPSATSSSICSGLLVPLDTNPKSRKLATVKVGHSV